MTRICVDTPAGRACYDDRRQGHRYPYSSHGYGSGIDRGELARRKRRNYWDRQQEYREDEYYRRDPRDLDGDGRVERWERQQMYRDRHPSPHYYQYDRRYGGPLPTPPRYQAAPSVSLEDQAAGLRRDILEDGRVSLDELQILLDGMRLPNGRGTVPLLSATELNTLREDARDGSLDSPILGAQLRKPSEGTDVGELRAQAADIVNRHSGRSR